jgi:hypothetical protein
MCLKFHSSLPKIDFLVLDQISDENVEKISVFRGAKKLEKERNPNPNLL